MNFRKIGLTMNIILFGPPGVGKGTVAAILSKKLGIPHVSSGNILRELMKKEDFIQIASIMGKGSLVPDEIVIDIIQKRLKEEDCQKGFILDGFPRTIEQAEFLENNNIAISHVFRLLAPPELLIKRITGRRLCTRCDAIYHIKTLKPKKEGFCDMCHSKLYQREDDKPEAARERFEMYEKQTTPLVAYYRKKRLLIDIDTDKPLEAIFKDIIDKLDINKPDA